MQKNLTCRQPEALKTIARTVGRLLYLGENPFRSRWWKFCCGDVVGRVPRSGNPYHFCIDSQKRSKETQRKAEDRSSYGLQKKRPHLLAV